MEKSPNSAQPPANNFVEALTMLNSQLLRPFYEEATSLWSGFREDQLWTVEVNNLYTSNMSQLKDLFKHYASHIDEKKLMLKKWNQQLEFMSVDDCIRMVCEDSDQRFTIREVRVIFGLSKMAIREDSTEQGILKL